MIGEGAREISFGIRIDPATRRLFVEDVKSTVQQAGLINLEGQSLTPAFTGAAGGIPAAAEKIGEAAGFRFGAVFNKRALMGLAIAAFAMGKLMNKADVNDPGLTKLKADMHELAQVAGSELQAGLGAAEMALDPLIRGFTNTDGAIRGAVLGLGFFMFAARPATMILRGIGIAGASVHPILMAIAGAFMVATAAMEHYGQQRVAISKAATAAVSDIAQGKTVEQLEEEIRLRQAMSGAIQTQSAEQQILATNLDGTITEMRNMAAVDATMVEQKKKNQSLDAATIKGLQDRVALMKEIAAQSGGGITDSMLTAGQKLDEINTKIATGELNLSKARAQVKDFTADILKARLADLEAGKKDAEIAAKIATELKDQLKDQKEEEARGIIAKAVVAEKTKQILAAQMEVNQGLQAEAGFTTRIGQENEKQATALKNIAKLIAENLDLTSKSVGPVDELANAQRRYNDLVAHNKGQTEEGQQALHDVLTLTKQVQDAEQQRLDKSRELTDSAKKEAEATEAASAAYLRAVLASIGKLNARSESQFQQQRIDQLKQELGLTNLTADAIVAKSRALVEAERIMKETSTPVAEGPNLDLTKEIEKNKVQQEGIKELIDLLQKQRDAERAVWDPMISGARNASQRAAEAIGELFTKGRMDAKKFANDLKDIFIKMLEEMLAAQIFSTVVNTFLAIFSGGIFSTGGGGQRFAPVGGGTIGTQGLEMPRMPRISLPTLGGGQEIQDLRMDINRLRQTIELQRTQPLVAEGILEGSNMRIAVRRADVAANARSG